MPNDVPDWSGVNLAPAEELASFDVPAGTTVTVYNGAVVPGTHALKIYVQTTSGVYKAAEVKITDTTIGAVLEDWVNPVSSSLVTLLDDLSVPTIKVDVTALATLDAIGSVICFLSDQAIAVSNDPSSPVPFVPAPPPAVIVAPIDASVAAGATHTLIAGASGKIMTLYGGVLGVSTAGGVGGSAGTLQFSTPAELIRCRYDIAGGTGTNPYAIPAVLYPIALVAPQASATGAGLQATNDAGSASSLIFSGYVAYTQH